MEVVIADSEKAAMETEPDSDAVGAPRVPVTIKLSVGPGLIPARALIVSVLGWPGMMEGGLNAQLAGALPKQPRLILPANP